MEKKILYVYTNTSGCITFHYCTNQNYENFITAVVTHHRILRHYRLALKLND